MMEIPKIQLNDRTLNATQRDALHRQIVGWSDAPDVSPRPHRERKEPTLFMGRVMGDAAPESGNQPKNQRGYVVKPIKLSKSYLRARKEHSAYRKEMLDPTLKRREARGEMLFYNSAATNADRYYDPMIGQHYHQHHNQRGVPEDNDQRFSRELPQSHGGSTAPSRGVSPHNAAGEPPAPAQSPRRGHSPRNHSRPADIATHRSGPPSRSASRSPTPRAGRPSNGSIALSPRMGPGSAAAGTPRAGSGFSAEVEQQRLPKSFSPALEQLVTDVLEAELVKQQSNGGMRVDSFAMPPDMRSKGRKISMPTAAWMQRTTRKSPRSRGASSFGGPSRSPGHIKMSFGTVGNFSLTSVPGDSFMSRRVQSSGHSGSTRGHRLSQ